MAGLISNLDFIAKQALFIDNDQKLTCRQISNRTIQKELSSDWRFNFTTHLLLSLYSINIIYFFLVLTLVVIRVLQHSISFPLSVERLFRFKPCILCADIICTKRSFNHFAKSIRFISFCGSNSKRF